MIWSQYPRYRKCVSLLFLVYHVMQLVYPSLSISTRTLVRSKRSQCPPSPAPRGGWAALPRFLESWGRGWAEWWRHREVSRSLQKKSEAALRRGEHCSLHYPVDTAHEADAKRGFIQQHLHGETLRLYSLSGLYAGDRPVSVIVALDPLLWTCSAIFSTFWLTRRQDDRL